MESLKSTTIVPLAFYCFVIAGYFLYLTTCALFSSNSIFSSSDFTLWVPGLSFAFFGCGLIAVGIGLLREKQIYWRILFFSLAISISSIASLLIAFIIILLLDPKFLDPYFQLMQTTTTAWFTFLSFFLSEIIVLYYLTREEVVASFGGMGELISPF